MPPKKGWKTHCKRGHLYTEANTQFKRDGTRCCRECKRQAQKRYERRKWIIERGFNKPIPPLLINRKNTIINKQNSNE